MSRYAKDTSVSVEKSRAEIETILNRYGADAFAYMSQPGRAAIGFRVGGRQLRFVLPIPDREQYRTYKSRGYTYRRSSDAAVYDDGHSMRSA